MPLSRGPRGGDWLEDEARAWSREGIDVVVSLLEPDEAIQLGLRQEQSAASGNGIKFIQFPIADRGVPESTDAARLLVVSIRQELEQGATVAVHCRQSVGRAGLITAAVLASSGVAPDHAIQVVTDARGVAVPETTQQRDWLLKLPREREAALR